MAGATLGSARPLHVAMFIPALGGGGAERVFVQVANGLARRGVRVDLLVATAGGHYQQHVAESVNLVDLGKRRTLGSLRSIRRYMRDVRPDVMLSTLTSANVVALLGRLFLPDPPAVVIRETILMSENLRAGFRNKLMRVAARMLYAGADGVVSLSKGVAADLERLIPGLRDRIRVIYNPAPTAQELSMGGRVSETFLESKARGPVLVALGRLHSQKDYPTLIRAFEKVRAVRAATLWILGDGEERPALEHLITRLGLSEHVFMPGFVADPYPYLREADVFVMSSRYEGGPSSMLQAMACGCRIVSTDCPSGPAEFLEGGKQGSLVPVGDPDAFADAVLRKLDEPLNFASRENSMRRFDPEFVISEFLDVLRCVTKPVGREKQVRHAAA